MKQKRHRVLKLKLSEALVMAAVFGTSGVLLLTAGHALTSTSSFEAESSGVSSPADIVSDGTASGGSAVKFGSQVDTTAAQIKALLTGFTPGTAHEATPHGVPSNYDWQAKSTLKNPSPPDPDMTYLNIRGAVYVDSSNVRPSNTRVEIMNCQSYGLLKSDNAWHKIIDLSPSKITGRGWHEDFSTPGDPVYTDIRTEADGGKSVTNFDGYNLHYYNAIGQAPLVYVGSNYSDFVTACSTRLVLANTSLADDRATSTYLVDVGNDWKRSDNSCTTNAQGATLCYAIGAGRFLKVTNAWRRVVYSTLDLAALDSKPLPPEELFLNPDGSFGD